MNASGVNIPYDPLFIVSFFGGGTSKPLTFNTDF